MVVPLLQRCVVLKIVVPSIAIFDFGNLYRTVCFGFLCWRDPSDLGTASRLFRSTIKSNWCFLINWNRVKDISDCPNTDALTRVRFLTSCTDSLNYVGRGYSREVLGTGVPAKPSNPDPLLRQKWFISLPRLRQDHFMIFNWYFSLRIWN